MPRVTGKFTHFLYIAALVFCLCSCKYEPSFDSLSAYPSNSSKLPIQEVELVPIAKNLENEAVNPESDQFGRASEVVIQKGVKAFPFNKASIRGSSKFTLLDSFATGFRVTNSGQIDANHADKLWSPFTASGIAIGDIDNDGFPDIFVANRQNGGRLFKNLGQMAFKDVTTEYGINIESMWGTAPTFVDINDDGLLDIYLCGYDSPNRLYINRGSKFKEQSNRFGLNFSGASAGAAFADYDRDGDLDLFLLTGRLTPKEFIEKLPVDHKPDEPPRIKKEFREQNHIIQVRNGNFRPIESGQYDHLFRNDGYRFVDATEESKIGSHPYRGMSSVWWDFNNDHWPDLYVSNNHKDPDQLFRNDGPNDNGVVTFSEVSASALSHVPWFSKGVDFGDVNNDGLLELLATGTAGNDQYSRIMSNGNLYGPRGDAWFLNWGKPPQIFANTAFLNNGTERFVDVAPMAGLAHTGWAWSVRIEDFDNDGLSDVIYSNGMVRDLLNNDLTRELRKLDPESKQEFWLKKPMAGLADRVFRNRGNLEFEEVGQKWGFSGKSVSQTLATGDLDNDGDLDIVTGGFGEDVRVYRNDLTPRNSVRVQLAGVQSNSLGIGSWVRLQVAEGGPVQVRYVSPTRGFQSTSEAILQFGVGDANLVHLLEVIWPSGSNQKLFKLRTNYLYRIEEPKSTSFVGHSTQDQVRVTLFAKDESLLNDDSFDELEFDDFKNQPLLPFRHSRLGPGISWADIDGDGDYDMFRGGPAFDQGVIYENLGRGKFRKTEQPCFLSDSRAEDLGSVFFDVDGDSDVDLFVVSGGVEYANDGPEFLDRLYLNNGNGSFEKSENLLPSIRFSGGSAAAADFDKDGKIDLFVGGRVVPGQYPESPRSILLRNTDEGFVDVTEKFAPEIATTGMVTSAVWADVNGDDWPDLMLCHEWGPVKCFQNDEGQLAEVSEIANLGNRIGLYNSVCAGDVDNDGDLDFVVGNQGLNTSYQANESAPIHIYYGDFGSDDSKRIVEAVTENNQIFPRRGLELLQNHITGLGQKYETVSRFAQSTLPEILDREKLSIATHLQANSLESIILVNESDASGIKFSTKPLPRLAQTSPIYGSQLCDVDGDGNLDLFVIQNNSNVFDETVPFTSGVGLLMTGNGIGDFTPVPPSKSGMELTANGTSLTLMDVDDNERVDFVAATNDDGIHVFTNRSRHTPLLIDIAKLSERRNYIGTKVILELFDGSQQMHQIVANNGYLSQSPPAIFTGKNQISKIHIRWPDGTTMSGSADDFATE